MDQQALFPQLEITLETYSETEKPAIEAIARSARDIATRQKLEPENLTKRFSQYMGNNLPSTNYFTVKQGHEIIGFVSFWDGWVASEGEQGEARIEFGFTKHAFPHQEYAQQRVREELRKYHSRTREF